MTFSVRAASVVALAALVAGCGGGGGGSSPVTTPSPTPAPTSTPVGFVFGGSSATQAFASGTTPGAVSLSAYHSIAATVQFVAPTSGSGSLVFSDALNGALGVSDVTGGTLPADNATAGYTPIIYIAANNNGTTDIAFGSALPQVQVADTALTGTYTSCNFDAYGSQGNSNAPSWFTTGVSGSVTASGVTAGPGTLGGGATVDFKANGQQILAISCH